MSLSVFEWTRTVISQQYLDSMCLDSVIDRQNIIKDMALVAKVKVELNDNGQVFLEGDWRQLMEVHVMLMKWKDQKEEEKTASCEALIPARVVTQPPIVKTSPKTVVHYIKQKYINASRRRRSLIQSKKIVTEANTDSNVQGNEVYVNITVSDGDISKISSLFASGQEILSLSDAPHFNPVEQNPDHSFSADWQEVDKLPQSLYTFDESLVPASEPAIEPKKPCTKKKDYEKLAPFKFFCKLCSFKSKRESHYQRHLELHNKVSELFCCSKCDFTTIRLGHLRRHELTHSDTKLKCDMCHYHTDHLKFLLRHQRIKHCNAKVSTVEKQLLRCTNCDYSTTRPYLYQRHLQAHSSTSDSNLKEEPRFNCQQCSYKTARKEHFIRHVNNVHNNKRPYLCDHCGKAFKRPDALKQHRVTHVELDPSLEVFRCPVCGKCCRAQAQLTQHLAVHSNVRAFLCEICGSSFKTRAVQRKHVLTIHKNPKAFSCLQCSRKFNTKYALRRHMKQHSLDKKRKSGGSTEEPAATTEANKQLAPATETERTLRVLMSEPILIQETPPTQVQDSQKAITVQVIGFMQ